MTEPNRNGREQ